MKLVRGGPRDRRSSYAGSEVILCKSSRFTPSVELLNCGSRRLVGKAESEGARSPRWLYSDFVVDGTLNPLFATKISFGCLKSCARDETTCPM